MKLLFAIIIGATVLGSAYYRFVCFNAKSLNFAFKVSIFIYLSLAFGMLFLEFDVLHQIFPKGPVKSPPDDEFLKLLYHYGLFLATVSHHSNNSEDPFLVTLIFGLVILFGMIYAVYLAMFYLYKLAQLNAQNSKFMAYNFVVFLALLLLTPLNFFLSYTVLIILWLSLFVHLGAANVLLGPIVLPINLGIIGASLYNGNKLDILSILGLVDIFGGHAFVVGITIVILTSMIGAMDTMLSLSKFNFDRFLE